MRSAPKLSATMTESPHYQTMGVGLTDRLFLVGHSDHLPLNEPYPVASMKQAVRDLGADTESPLLIGLMEAYFSGARDIWLVASAPMSEYEPDIEERDQAYYQQYRDRLDATYNTLKKWDIAQITVPIDAPFNSTVDFLTPLVQYCADAFNLSGEIHLGIMGTRGTITEQAGDDAPPGAPASLIDAMVNDGRLDKLGEAGKFVSIFVGDATFHLKELPFNHTSSVAVAVAAEMAQLPLDRGLTYHRLKNVISVLGPDLSKGQIQTLAEAGLNPVGRDIRGRRGESFRVIPYTDNTLAQEGSDFWSLTQMRLVSRISAEIRAIGTRAIGTIGFDIFKTKVEDYLLNLAGTKVIRGYDLRIDRDIINKHLVLVDVNVIPYIGVRELHIPVKVGPYNGA